EPEDSARIEDERMRIARLWRLIFGDRPRLRVELADQRSGIPRVPDVTVLIFHQTMRSGVRRLEGIFLDFPCLRIEPPEHIGHLARVPERTVPRRQRIVRPR